MFLRVERSPLRQQELTADAPRQPSSTTTTSDALMTSDDPRDMDCDVASLVSRDELEVDDLSETASCKSSTENGLPVTSGFAMASAVTSGLAVASFGSAAASSGPTMASSEVQSSASAITSMQSNGSPSKSNDHSSPASVADLPSAEWSAGLQSALSASLEQLPPVTSSCKVVVPPSTSFESSSPVHRPAQKSSTVLSSRMEQTVANSQGRVPTAASTGKIAVVPPLAKKGAAFYCLTLFYHVHCLTLVFIF